MVVLDGHFKGVAWNQLVMWFTDLEVFYDAIGLLVAQGLVLDTIRLQQQGQCSSWPVEIFTAQSLESQTQPLRQVWEELLPALSRVVQVRAQRQAYLRRQVSFYESQIERLAQRIARTQAALQVPVRFHDSFLIDRRQSQLEQQLANQQAILAHLQAASGRVIAYQMALVNW